MLLLIYEYIAVRSVKLRQESVWKRRSSAFNFGVA